MKRALIPASVICGVLAVGAAFFFIVDSYGSARPSELLGSWRGSQGAELTLYGDGTLSGKRVPTDFSDDGVPVKWFTGKGEWKLEEKPSFPKFGDQEIAVSLGEVFGSKTGIRMDVKGKGARDGISIPVSYDTGKEFVFKRR